MVRDLVVQAPNGDRDAFAALVHLTSDRMYALASRILRDSDLAEDALQGALITVRRQLPTLRATRAVTSVPPRRLRFVQRLPSNEGVALRGGSPSSGLSQTAEKSREGTR